MNGSAWVMLVCTWGVVSYFTFKYFAMVVRTPPRGEDEEDESHRS